MFRPFRGKDVADYPTMELEIMKLKSERRLLLVYVFSTLPNAALIDARVDYDKVDVTKVLSALQSGAMEISLPVVEKGKKYARYIPFPLNWGSESQNGNPVGRGTHKRDKFLGGRSQSVPQFLPDGESQKRIVEPRDNLRRSKLSLSVNVPEQSSVDPARESPSPKSVEVRAEEPLPKFPVINAVPEPRVRDVILEDEDVVGELPRRKQAEKRNFAAVSFLDVDSSPFSMDNPPNLANLRTVERGEPDDARRTHRRAHSAGSSEAVVVEPLNRERVAEREKTNAPRPASVPFTAPSEPSFLDGLMDLPVRPVSEGQLKSAALELLLSYAPVITSSDQSLIESTVRVNLAIPKAVYRSLLRSSVVSDSSSSENASFHYAVIMEHPPSHFSSAEVYEAFVTRHAALFLNVLKFATEQVSADSKLLKDEFAIIEQKMDVLVSLSASNCAEEDVKQTLSAIERLVTHIISNLGSVKVLYPVILSNALYERLLLTSLDPDTGSPHLWADSVLQLIQRVEEQLGINDLRRDLCRTRCHLTAFVHHPSMATLSAVSTSMAKWTISEITNVDDLDYVMSMLELLIEVLASKMSHFATDPFLCCADKESPRLQSSIELWLRCRSLVYHLSARRSEGKELPDDPSVVSAELSERFRGQLTSVLQAGAREQYGNRSEAVDRPVGSQEWPSLCVAIEKGFDDMLRKFARQIDRGVTHSSKDYSFAVKLISESWTECWRQDVLGTFCVLEVCDEHTPKMMRSFADLWSLFKRGGVETLPINFNDLFASPSLQWIRQRRGKLEVMMKRAVSTDKWEPMSRMEGHTTSAVDLAAIIRQTIPFLLDIPFVDPVIYALPLAEMTCEIIYKWAQIAAMTTVSYPVPSAREVATRVASLRFVRTHVTRFAEAFDAKGVIVHKDAVMRLDQQLDHLATETTLNIGVAAVRNSLPHWYSTLYVPNIRQSRIGRVLQLFNPILSDISSLGEFLPDEVVSIAIEETLGELCRQIRGLLLTSKTVMYSESDGPLFETDIEHIKEFFISRDEHGNPQGLPVAVASRRTHSLSSLVNTLFSVSTDDLITMYNDVPADGSSSGNATAGRMTDAVLTKEVIGSVLAHRTEKSAKRFHAAKKASK